MKLAGLCICLVALTNTACAAGPTRSESQLLRSYAVAQCIARAYPGTDAASDAKAAAAGYMEFGNVEADAYSAMVELAENARQRQYRGKNGEPLHMMKCIDLAFSSQLDEAVRAYVSNYPELKE